MGSTEEGKLFLDDSQHMNLCLDAQISAPCKFSGLRQRGINLRGIALCAPIPSTKTNGHLKTGKHYMAEIVLI